MQAKNTIWLVLDSRVNGGIETHVLELARGLRQHGQAVTVVFLVNHGEHPLREALRAAGIDNLSLDGNFSSLLASVANYDPVLIHSHGYKAGILCCAAALFMGINHVSTFHAGEPGKGRVALYDWLHRQASRFIDFNFAVSAEIAERLPASPAVLDNFITLPDLLPKTGRRLAFVGRLSEEKGPDRLLALAARLRHLQFDVYGDGPLMTTLKNQATENCFFHGSQPDMGLHWSDIDLLLMPSVNEGLPMAALEAMARGIPIVAFDVGALNKVVTTGVNGWLVASGDLDGFQAAIENWLSMDCCDKERMRDAARSHIRSRFSSTTMIPRILGHYRKIAAGKIPACDAFCD